MSGKILKFGYSSSGVSIPEEFAVNDFILVGVDGRALDASEYNISNDGKGGRVLTLTVPASEVCLAYLPGVDFAPTKLSPEFLRGFTDYVERVELRIEALTACVDAAMGGIFADFVSLPELEAKVTELAARVAALSPASVAASTAQDASKRIGLGYEVPCLSDARQAAPRTVEKALVYEIWGFRSLKEAAPRPARGGVKGRFCAPVIQELRKGPVQTFSTRLLNQEYLA